MAKDLTQKQTDFVHAYIEAGNGCEAYRTAYPASRRWKQASVERAALRLLDRPRVKARVKELRAKAQSEAVATLHEVLAMLSRIVRACPASILDETGCVDMERLKDARQELASIEVEETPEGRQYKEKYHDAIQAADRLAKLQGWDKPQRIEHSGNVNHTIVEVVRHDDGRG